MLHIQNKCGLAGERENRQPCLFFLRIRVVHILFTVYLVLVNRFLAVAGYFYSFFLVGRGYLLCFRMLVICRRFYMQLYCILRFVSVDMSIIGHIV